MSEADNEKLMSFVGGRTQELIRAGISVHLTNKDAINNMYGGSFCAHNKVFRVAMGNGLDSLHSFVHEYAHFLQFRNRKDFWDSKVKAGIYVFFGWLDGDPYTKAEVDKALKLTIEMEHDCEQTALSVISAYELPINKRLYSQVAGMNLMSYHDIARNRKWRRSGFSVEEDPKTLAFIPGKLPPVDFFLDKDNIQKFSLLLETL